MILLNNKYLIQVLQRMKPIVYYFPVMITLYFIFSLFLTDNTLGIILNEAIFGCLKLFLMMGAMMFFFESTQSQDIVIIARSIWVRLNKPWKWVEDFFLFLGMTLRFYPTFQSNWQSLRNTRKSLGLETDLSYLEGCPSDTNYFYFFCLLGSPYHCHDLRLKFNMTELDSVVGSYKKKNEQFREKLKQRSKFLMREKSFAFMGQDGQTQVYIAQGKLHILIFRQIWTLVN